MSYFADALWLSVSPTLQRFDRPLLRTLAQTIPVAQWAYSQTLDEPTSLDAALILLHNYLQDCDRPLHLLGHGTSGLLALLYARQYPEKVRSLTLLSVGVNPAIDWQSHYYAQRRLIPCPQETILRQMVYGLWGSLPRDATEKLTQILEQDLYQSLSPHHLMRSISFLPIGIDLPVLICGGAEDMVIDPRQLQGWRSHLHHAASRVWACPKGRYFFHHADPNQVSRQILKFWRKITSEQRDWEPSRTNIAV